MCVSIVTGLNTDPKFIEVCLQREIDPDIGSRLIMFGMRTNYSHALIRFIKDGEVYVYEAVGVGVQIVKESEVMPGHAYEHVYRIPLTVAPEVAFAYMLGSEGKEYSNRQLVAIALMDRLHIGKLRLSMWYNGKTMMICSESCARFLKHNCDLLLKGDLDFIKPTDLETQLHKYKR